MGVRILHDQKNEIACLYCSTSDVAFGPVFYALDRGALAGLDADERAESFLRWIDSDACEYRRYEKTQIGDRRDARCLTDAGLQDAYSDWLAQEAAQWKREEAALGGGGPDDDEVDA